MGQDLIWRPVLPEAICWRSWDDELVLYNDATGATHHLNPLGSEVVCALLACPRGISEADLASKLALLVDSSEESVLRAQISQTLIKLDELQLAAAAGDVFNGTG
jgi:PqqD family protein of HPr-rel-A system